MLKLQKDYNFMEKIEELENHSKEILDHTKERLKTEMEILWAIDHEHLKWVTSRSYDELKLLKETVDRCLKEKNDPNC